MKYWPILSLLPYLLIAGCLTGRELPTARGLRTAATASPPLTCDEIVHPALLSAPFEDFKQGAEAIERWIHTEFPDATISYPQEGYYDWTEGKQIFQLTMVSPIQSINQVSNRNPTIGDLLNCFGDPTFFSIARARGVESSGIGMAIWYAKQGMIFGTSTFGWNAERKKFTVATWMDGRVGIVPPGTPEEMMRSLANPSEEYIEMRLPLLQEWPEDFTELTLKE